MQIIYISQMQICSLSSIVFYSFFILFFSFLFFFFLFLGRSNVGDYFEKCFVIFWNRQTRVQFWKPGGLTAVRKVHWKFKISDFGSLKNWNDRRFLVIEVQLISLVRVSKPCLKVASILEDISLICENFCFVSFVSVL